MPLRLLFSRTGYFRVPLSVVHTTCKPVLCRHASNTTIPRKPSRLGYVVGGTACCLLGIGAGNMLRDPLLSWWKENESPPVLADTNPRQQFNNVADLLQNKAKGIVAIDSWLAEENNRKIYDYGVGFVDDSSGLVITNESFIQFHEEKLYQVMFDDGSAYYARVVSLDNHSDLAALRLCDDQGKVRDTGGIPTVKLNSSPLRLGERMVAITMREKDRESSVYKVFCGYLSNSEFEGATGTLLLMATSATDDAFGGPVLNTDGEIVGVVTPRELSGASLCIPYSYVQKFIERSLRHEKFILQKEEEIRREKLEAKKHEEEKQRKELEALEEERKKLLAEEQSK